MYGVFKDYIHASKFLDFVWSEKLGYLLLHIDPTKNTIEEDQIIASADELCAELFNEVATDVFQEAKREHFYPDADDDEIDGDSQTLAAVSRLCFLSIGFMQSISQQQNKAKKHAFTHELSPL